jgi:release factor glutamine methyltransferase
VQLVTIKDWLSQAATRLSDVKIKSPVLDAELILSHALKTDRTFLHAHGNHRLRRQVEFCANHMLKRRLKQEPLAYILKTKEFYGQDFHVSPAVLVPRPETEKLVELVLDLKLAPGSQVVDVGTGSGSIGISIKLASPQLKVTLVDVDSAALAVARRNASALKADVVVTKNDLLSDIDQQFDVVVANLPYLKADDKMSPGNAYEPKLALLGGGDGLDLIRRLILQSNTRLKTGGYLVLESNVWQRPSLIKFGVQNGYKAIDVENPSGLDYGLATILQKV